MNQTDFTCPIRSGDNPRAVNRDSGKRRLDKKVTLRREIEQEHTWRMYYIDHLQGHFLYHGSIALSSAELNHSFEFRHSPISLTTQPTWLRMGL
jgi:hypothetical protein